MEGPSDTFLFYYTIQESAVYLHVYNCLSVFELYSDY